MPVMSEHPLRPYTAPEVRVLGSLSGSTAGPDGGDIDQLVGSSGGFQTPNPS